MRAIVITGASSGMGREMALQLDKMLATSSFEFWLIARREDRLKDLSSKLCHSCRIMPLDITKEYDIMKLKAQLERLRPNVLLAANAAGYGIIGRFEDTDIADQTGMVDLNCKALIEITHSILPYMHENARIINFASSAAFAPQPNFAVYAASKAFADSFNTALGRELAKRKIYVTSVCPGPVDTEFFEIAEKYEKLATFKKYFLAKPEDVAAKAIKDSINRRSASVYGGSMNLWRIVRRFIPTKLIMMFFK